MARTNLAPSHSLARALPPWPEGQYRVSSSSVTLDFKSVGGAAGCR